MKKPKSYYAAVLAGILLVLTLFLRYGVMDAIINSLLKSKLKLAPGTDVWKVWTELPIPMYSKFYFFNVTNPDQVIEGAKPILNEMGPYVYQEKRHKMILESNDYYVKYRPKITYTFRHDMSRGSPDDMITLLNVPYVAVAKIAWDISKESFMLSTLDDVLAAKGETLFHSNKVREFLFDGFSIENYMELFSLPVEAFGMKKEIPARVMDGDFGFFDDRNGTAEEVWVVGTGVKDESNFGKIISWNGNNSLNDWGNKKCDRIEGTDGAVFPPITDVSRILDVFHPDACRTLQMEYVAPGEFMEMKTHRYSFAHNTFDKVDECFCKETYEWCKKGGVFPIWPCVGGAPVFLSRPHFMGAHEDYRKAVIGLNGDGDFSSVLDIEQNIGLPIRANMKLQMNIELQPFRSMATFVNVPNMMFPVFWMEENLELSEEWAYYVRLLSYCIRLADSAKDLIILFCIIVIMVHVVLEGRKSNWFGNFFGIKFR